MKPSRDLNPAERAVEEIRAVRRAIWRSGRASPSAILTRLMDARRPTSRRRPRARRSR